MYPLVIEGALSFGVFAVIHDEHGRVLVKQRSDKLWDLPGGGVKPSEKSTLGALAREVKEEVGLTVLGAIPLGPPLPIHILEGAGRIDIAQAFVCITVGKPCTNSEAINVDWLEHDEVTGMITKPRDGFKFVGPSDRVGRMTRMILDGVVIHFSPDIIRTAEQQSDIILSPGYHASTTGQFLVKHTVDSEEVHFWKRLDPFTKSGLVE